MTPRKLNIFILGLSFTGILWIIINAFFQADIPVCIFNRVTGISCPSCGITRTIESVLRGDVYPGGDFNLLGYILLPFILVFPFWIIIDLLRKKTTFYLFYRSAETLLRRRMFAIPLITLVIINWAWNIFKHFTN